MKKTIGYIVFDKGGAKGLAESNVLWYCDKATMFVTRKDAQNAINRTAKYAAKHGYQWGMSSWYIMRTVSA